MPTFGLPEDVDVLPHGVDSYFRHFLGTSTQHLKQKKFYGTHEKELAAVQKKNGDRDIVKRKARQEFEEKRKRHRETFQEANTPSISENVADVDFVNVSQNWYNEYEHPSCTANISGEGIVFDISPAKVTSSKPTDLMNKPQCVFDTSLNCSLDAFSDISVFSKSSNNATLSGLKLSTTVAPKGIFNLENYTGARPSFGGSLQTSTPYAHKILKKLDAVPEDNKSSYVPEDKENIVAAPVSDIPRENLASINVFKSHSLDKFEFPQIVKSVPTKQSTVTNDSEVKYGLACYYSLEVDKKEDNDLAKMRFERSNATLRSSIKRTIVEKLSVVAKKFAKADEISEAADFFKKLIRGHSVIGANNAVFTLDDPDALCYAKNVLIDHCLGLVERDTSLVKVLANILRSLVESHPEFGSLLVGKLFSASVLLNNDGEKSSKFVTELSQKPGDLKTFLINKEKAIISLFCHIHILGKRCGSVVFSPARLWRLLAHITDSPYCVLSTVLILNVILENCGLLLSSLYPNQWPKIVRFLRSKMLPEMEHGLMNVEERRIGGEAVYISLFRDVLDTL